MKKLGLSLLALCCSFVLVSQADAMNANNGNSNGLYHDQNIDCSKEYKCAGQCVTTCPVKTYKRCNYCVTKYYQEPYTVQKQCCRQVPQYYEKTHCRMVPEYYKTTHCRYVSQPYTVCETKYRCKSYQENHCYYKPCIKYKTFCTPCQGEEPCPQPACPCPCPAPCGNGGCAGGSCMMR